MKKPRFFKTVRRFIHEYKNPDTNLYSSTTVDWKGTGHGFTKKEARKAAIEARKTFEMW